MIYALFAILLIVISVGYFLFARTGETQRLLTDVDGRLAEMQGRYRTLEDVRTRLQPEVAQARESEADTRRRIERLADEQREIRKQIDADRSAAAGTRESVAELSRRVGAGLGQSERTARAMRAHLLVIARTLGEAESLADDSAPDRERLAALIHDLENALKDLKGRLASLQEPPSAGATS